MKVYVSRVTLQQLAKYKLMEKIRDTFVRTGAAYTGISFHPKWKLGTSH